MCDLDYPISRVSFIGAAGAIGIGGAVALGTPSLASAESLVAQGGGTPGPLKVRWLGGGVSELATLDDKQIVLVDAWIWNNTGYTAFGLSKPPELSSAAAYADHLASRKPDGVFVLLTHDHGDHIGDYFELLNALSDRKLNVKTAGQVDMMRAALVPKFKEANLDRAAIVANDGNGMNFGGVAAHAGIRATLVPAIHSTLSGVPAAGFVVRIGTTTVYCSGDTDLFSDMALIGRRYKPDLMLVCIGNGAFTMGPVDAAEACRLVGAPSVVPVHYAHNRYALGPEAGETFRAEMARVAPRTRVTVMKPGSSTQIG
jgi:L-ascorbate metabolism protein UlaG (beta-lactamase superfamily)